MNMAEFLARAASACGERPAISLGEATHCTYETLACRAGSMAGYLKNELGMKPGDRAAITMKNCPAFLEVLYAIWHAGCCALPINAKLHPREMAFILENAGARCCFATSDLMETVAPLADEIETLESVMEVDTPDYRAIQAREPVPIEPQAPDDLAWLFYTSGTTGRPKGAMLTHQNLHSMSLSYFADVDPVSENDCILHAAPLSHGSGLYAIPHVYKGANNIVPESGGFEPPEIFRLIEAYPGLAMFAAPTMVTRLVQSEAIKNADTRNLKTIAYGGGPMYLEDLKMAMEALGNKLVQVYGQGESPMTITVVSRERHVDTQHPRFEERLASVGVPHTVVEVRVVDAEDNTLPPEETGEVLVRGDVVMKGYWNNPEATENALKGGWLHTGDVGVMDEDGFLTLKDRSKDLIISGGSNIYPREVEEVLLRHEGVLEVSVIGRPHPDWGEEVMAFVVCKDGQEVGEKELDGLCLEHIARFKRPRAYRFIEALPKNNYGKVLKTALREMVEGDSRESDE